MLKEVADSFMVTEAEIENLLIHVSQVEVVITPE
jgi:hypothetical protein